MCLHAELGSLDQFATQNLWILSILTNGMSAHNLKQNLIIASKFCHIAIFHEFVTGLLLEYVVSCCR